MQIMYTGSVYSIAVSGASVAEELPDENWNSVTWKFSIKGSALKVVLAFMLVFGLALSMGAQRHYNAWFRATASLSMRHNLRWDNEFQHRRQNGYGNENRIDRNLMFTYRTWLHYQWTDQVKFSLSPFSCFSHYRIIQRGEDAAAQPISEYRAALAVEWQKRLGGVLRLLGREGLEFRMFHAPRPDVFRLRNRWGLKWAFTESLQLMIFDELFLAWGRDRARQIFDHNRLGAQLDFRLSQRIRLEAGWMHIARQVDSSEGLLREHNVFLNMTYLLSLPRRMH